MKKKPTPPPITEFENDHDGNKAKAVYLDAIETEAFADPLVPLQTFLDLRMPLMNVSNDPAKVISVFEQHTDTMTVEQKLFIAEKVKSYFANTVFREDEADEESEGVALTGIVETLRSYIRRIELSTIPQVGDIRATLKEIFRKEIERLPEVLSALDDKDRLNFLCKMMPFVLPKVEAIVATKGEPGVWG